MKLITSGQKDKLGQLAEIGAKQGLAETSKENAQLAVVNSDIFQEMMGEAARRAVEFIAMTSKSSQSQVKARRIMGSNYFGVEEATKHFGITPTLEELQTLEEVPYSEEELRACKTTHILVAVFPLSILDIRSRVERALFYRHEDAWYNSQAFAQEKGTVGWYLVRKDEVPGSLAKNWSEQGELLDKELEEVPTAQVMVYTIIGHFLATGERIFMKLYARTASIDSGGSLVRIGSFDGDGLDVDSYWGSYRGDDVGVSSSRKFTKALESLNP